MSNKLILDHILESEGWPAYTNHPADRGGPTKGGITLATLQAHRHGATVDDLKALTEEEARRIYEHSYILRPGFGEIADDLLRWQVVDAGVLSGPRRATEWLQEAAGTVVDGKLGPKTLAAVNAASAHRIGLRLCAIRQRFLSRLIAADPSQARWSAGWANRCTAFLDREADRVV